MEQVRRLLRDNIKKQRERLSWNQEKLAENCGLSTGYIKKIETCRQWPQPASLEAIAKAFDIEVGQLFIDESQVPLMDTITGALKTTLEGLGYEIKKKN